MLPPERRPAMRWWCALALVTGCGRLGFDGRAAGDARTTGSEAGSILDVAASTCRTAPGYLQVAGAVHAYKVVQGNDAWPAARSSCAADGAYLAILDDAAEAAILPGNGWVGLTDAATEGTWLTVHGDPAPFLPWKPAEPAGGSMKNCARFDDVVRQLEARGCTDTRDWVCECD
jgi:hypothetical protein